MQGQYIRTSHHQQGKGLQAFVKYSKGWKGASARGGTAKQRLFHKPWSPSFHLGRFGNTLRRARTPHHIVLCTCKVLKVISFHSSRTHTHLAYYDLTPVLSYYPPTVLPGGRNVSELLTALNSKLFRDTLPFVTIMFFKLNIFYVLLFNSFKLPWQHGMSYTSFLCPSQ